MALIKCGECGREISNKASGCPQCGAPVAKPLPPGVPANWAAELAILKARKERPVLNWALWMGGLIVSLAVVGKACEDEPPSTTRAVELTAKPPQTPTPSPSIKEPPSLEGSPSPGVQVNLETGQVATTRDDATAPVETHDTPSKPLTKRQKQQMAALARGEAQLHDLETVCGPRPSQSPWDGMFSAVNRFLKDNLNDPSGYEGLGCTEANLKNTTSCWVTTCKFRASNAFGAKVVQVKRFSIGRHPSLENMGVVIDVAE